MEFDGYNKDLGLAFECQGIQHRKKAFGMTDDDLINQQKEDALKLKLCEENGVTLLQICLVSFLRIYYFTTLRISNLTVKGFYNYNEN